MTEVIVAVFDTLTDADAAERELIGSGIPASAIRRYEHGDPGAPGRSDALVEQVPREQATVTQETTTHRAGFWAWVFPDEPTSYPQDNHSHSAYDEHLAARRPILSVHCVDHLQSADAMRILEGHSAAEIDSKREAALTGAESAPAQTVGDTETAMPHGSEAIALPPEPITPAVEPVAPSPRATSGGEEVIPLAEEKLEIGKRQVERGTTRVRKFVREEPAQASATLRDETVTIERRRVVDGAPASVDSPDAFVERTVEVRETAEEPVVAKVARVVEEVVVHREATERTETVQDTVRREEVEVHNDDKPAVTPSRGNPSV